MRLIDADTLEIKLDAELMDVSDYLNIHEQIKDIIDNAPTVPQDCSECKRYDFPYFVVKFDKEQMQELVDKAKTEVLASYEYTEEDIKETIKENFDLGYAMAKNKYERPQGEWKETGYETGALGITYRQTQCTNCGWEHALPMWWNFCPNCGAKMKGGAE